MNYNKIILNLIVFFCLSNNVSAQSYSQALLESAKAGQAKAQCELGLCYELGDGIKKNPVEAVKWYRKAAEQGYPEAYCYLAMCYEQGIGVKFDIKEAGKWGTLATEKGYATGIYRDKKIERQRSISPTNNNYSTAQKQRSNKAKSQNMDDDQDLGVPIENFSWQKLLGGKTSATFKYYGMGIRTTSVEQAMREMGLDWEDLIYDVTLTINANKTGKITYRIIPNEKAKNNQRIHYRKNGMKQRHYDFVSAFCDAVSHKGIIGESGQVQLHGDHFILCEYEFYPCDNYNSISVKGLMKMFKLKRVGK